MKLRDCFPNIKSILLSFFLAIFLLSGLNAQDEEPTVHKSRIKLEFLKKSDDSRFLMATLSVRINRRPVYISGQKILFYAVNDTLEQKLGEAITKDGSGKATLRLPDVLEGKDTAGYFNFMAVFEGADTIKASDNDLPIRDTKIELELTVDEDSVKNVSVSVVMIGADGEEMPVEDEEILFGVERLFSYLNFDEGYVEGGAYEAVFPDDLPGDTEGMVKIRAFIPDSEDFGAIEKEMSIDWGVPLVINEAELDDGSIHWTRYIVVFLLFVLPFIILSRLIYQYVTGKRKPVV